MCLKKYFTVLVVVFLFISQLGFAQVSTYGFGEAISTYTPLSTSTTAYTAPWDDHVSGSAYLAPLGFTFNYDGVNQTQCYISPNGFLSFGTQPVPTNYLPISVAGSFINGGTLSALGMDLISATDNIVFSTVGSAPNRVFVVQWTNARRKAITGNFNFQIRLVETTNVIEYSYGVCAPDDVTVFNAQLGIRGVTNSYIQGDIKNRWQTGINTNTTWFGKTINGTSSGVTVRTSVTEYPNNGLRYTFTPSTPCVTPTGVPSGLVIGSTSVSTTSFVGNSFTAATPAPTNYLVLRSTVNVPPTNLNVANRVYWAVGNIISSTYTVVSVTNATIFTQTALTPNTTYYYWAIPYNSGCLGGPFYNLSSTITASNTTCIAAPTGLIASTVEGNSFTASWAAVAGATDYQVDVSTNNTFTALLPSYTNVATAGATSLPIVGLNPLVTYYFRVRAVGLTCNVYSATASVVTLCGAFPIPYYQNFDTTPVATVPSCFTITNDNLDSVAWQIQNSIAASTPNAFHLATTTSLDTNDWFFTPGLNLTAGVSYRLKFKYTTLSAGLYAENLRIRLGTGPSEVTMNITILNLPNLINTVYQTATVDFTPVTNDVFYLGFQGYSFANQSKIVVDDISVIVSPTCFEPANVTVTSVTSSSVAITWEEPSPQPVNGYQYYVSTTNTTPSDTVTPTGSVGFGATTATVTGLAAATLYYIWVRGNCSVTDNSVWSSIQSFSTDCSASSYLAVTNGALCGGGSTVLQAISNPGATVEWYAEATGDTLLATGNNFTTPTLFTTTTYYAQSRAPGGLVVVGPTSPTLQGGALGVQQTQTFVSFSIATATTLQSFDIYPMVSGQSGVLVIRNSSNIALGTYPYVTSVAGGSTAQTIAINLILPVGSYSLYMDTLPTSGLLVNIDSAAYPYTSSIATITGNGYDNTFYLYAYNWKFSNICRSLLTPVTATVTAAPPISFSTTASTLCNGETTELVTVTGDSAYDTFTWSSTVGLNGTIATGFTFQPSVTTVYSLTASQSAGSLCTSVISYTVNVKPEPPAISILPPTATLCEGQVQPLNASLAASTPVTIYNETFNGVTNNWTTTNLSTGGLIANAAWTLRNSIYTYTSTYWNINMSSNDASRFYFSNSDSQGSPGTNRTLTYLISPSINLTGYTSASLSFWHYLRYIGGNKARVETSIDGGTTWTLLTSFILSKGTASGFVNAVVSMNSLVGNPDVKLRFLYDATWDYGWAIDNVKITGNLALEVTWLPSTGLYFDAAATVPYLAGTPTALIYAKPAVTTTYTGSVVGANGCSASNTTVLTVLPAPVPGLLTDNQIICGNALPTAIVLTGYSGPIIRWEYASDAAFTVGLTTVFITAASLSSGDIGTFPGDRYYRAVLQNGTCPLVYSNSVLISFPTTTWNGTAWSNGAPTASMKIIFNGNYSSLSSLNACSVEVVSGTVIVNSGHTLTVQNDVKVVGGTLTFQNNSSLVQVNNLDNNGAPILNTGNITYKRTSTPVKKYDYTYWSSPVSPQTLANFSVGSTKFYTYDSTAGTWVNAVTTIPMVAGKGYIIRTPDIAPFNVTTANYFFGSFIGVPNTGTYNVPIVGGANQSNMLGNPYPSALSADSFLSHPANVPVIDGTIYLWTHNTPITANQYTGNDYAVYNYVGGVGTSAVNIGVNNSIPNGKIASGQGFFVKGLSNGLVSYTNAMRLEGNNDQFFRMSTPTTTSVVDLEAHRFWLDIYNSEGAFKQLLIGYIENATNGLDRGFDGQMINGGNVILLYAIQDTKKLSIQGRALPFSTADVIPLGYKSTIASSYHISLSDFDGLFTTQTVYLEDALLNVVHNLSSGAYQFATDAGTFDTRFSLRFTNATLDVATPSFTANQVVIYKNTSNDFVITTGTTAMATVKVFDVRGRLLLEKKNINATETTVGGGMANEVLLIQITTVDGVVVTKRAIR